ncbi:hypothetical protein [Escherichia phage Ecp_YSF]|nr:hypothetical protein [Escherichia phage Ecp_YSF]
MNARKFRWSLPRTVSENTLAKVLENVSSVLPALMARWPRKGRNLNHI